MEMGVRTVRRDFSDKQVRRSLFRILRNNVLCSMATVTPEARAHINTAYFAYTKELEIVFVSYPDSHHARNLQGRSSMALTIFNSKQTWGRPDTGVQLFGTCRPAEKCLLGKLASVYSLRYPRFAKWKRQFEKEEGEFPLRFYRFVPRRATILDEREFGGGLFITVHLSRRKDHL